MDDLKITGTVTEILEEMSGEGRNGPWRKQDFVLETGGQYPRPVCITQWGDDIEKFAIREGETLTAHIDIRSREYEGRWYTDVKAWRVERPQPGPGDARQPPQEIPRASGGDGGGIIEPDDDLPF